MDAYHNFLKAKQAKKKPQNLNRGDALRCSTARLPSLVEGEDNDNETDNEQVCCVFYQLDASLSSSFIKPVGFTKLHQIFEYQTRYNLTINLYPACWQYAADFVIIKPGLAFLRLRENYEERGQAIL